MSGKAKEREENGFFLRYFQRNPYAKYVMPAMVILFVLSIVPTIFLLIISFTNYQLGWDLSRMKFVGLANYVRLFSGRDPDFWPAIGLSLSFMVITTCIQMFLGFVIALMLHSREFKLKPVVVGILIIPLAITPTIAGQMWKLMFNAEYGLINYILDAIFGIRVVWLASDMAFWSIVIVDVWQFTPFVALIIYAGLRSVPNEPYESAMIDGAGRMRILFSITIPMIRSLILLALLLRAVDALKLFDTAFVLTQGGPGNATEFLSLHVYRMINAQNGLIGRGAAVAVVLLILVSVVSNVLIRIQRREVAS
ncbi:MAG: sugar ABC transporter permease [Clostridia bacterium]